MHFFFFYKGRNFITAMRAGLQLLQLQLCRFGRRNTALLLTIPAYVWRRSVFVASFTAMPGCDVDSATALFNLSDIYTPCFIALIICQTYTWPAAFTSRPESAKNSVDGFTLSSGTPMYTMSVLLFAVFHETTCLRLTQKHRIKQISCWQIQFATSLTSPHNLSRERRLDSLRAAFEFVWTELYYGNLSHGLFSASQRERCFERVWIF